MTIEFYLERVETDCLSPFQIKTKLIIVEADNLFCLFWFQFKQSADDLTKVTSTHNEKRQKKQKKLE